MTNWQLARTGLLAIFFGSAEFGQLPVPPTGQVGQQGIVQQPLRVCVLHNFNAVANDPPQTVIADEFTAITQGPDGDDNFYGTTFLGGPRNLGTVYKIPYQPVSRVTDDSVSIAKTDDSPSVLFAFDNEGGSGANPEGGVVVGPDSFLYGTTAGGGTHAAGTVFKLSRSGGRPTPLYSFGDVKPTAQLSNNSQPTDQDLKNVNGSGLHSPLVVGNDNNIYGVTETANGAGTGTIFRVSPAGGLEYLYIFMPNGAKDYGMSPLTLAKGTDGMLYGTTLNGGDGFGTVFQFDPTVPRSVKTIYKFKEQSAANQLVQDSQGTLYGTTRFSGPAQAGRGTVFSLTTAGSYKLFYKFGGRESNPAAGLVLVHHKVSTGLTAKPGDCRCDVDPRFMNIGPPTPASEDADYLYGVATTNGVVYGGDLGIVFRMKTDGTDFATVYNFEGVTGGGPVATPVLARDHYLYGVTFGGGSRQGGVFYRLSTKYLVEGQPEDELAYGTLTTHTRMEFQGGPNTQLLNNPLMNVASDIAVYQPGQPACKNYCGVHAVRVRMKDPNAKVIQFYYREWIDLGKNNLASQNAHHKGLMQIPQPISNPDASPGIQELPIWDPTKTYPINYEVGVSQQNGFYLGFTSLVANNKGNPPNLSRDAWQRNALCDPDPPNHSSGLPNVCYPLTVNEAQPNWVPDLASMTDPHYNHLDTQVDCDGIEIFDSPSFFEDPAFANIEQRFTGIDFEISGITANGGAAVLGAVTWRRVKTGSNPPVYTEVKFLGPQSPGAMKPFHDILVRAGYHPEF